jgi:hypothetical protein
MITAPRAWQTNAVRNEAAISSPHRARLTPISLLQRLASSPPAAENLMLTNIVFGPWREKVVHMATGVKVQAHFESRPRWMPQCHWLRIFFTSS